MIDEYLETFLETAQRHADGCRLPAFVEQEFRDFLTCGVLAHGFARLRCAECAFERLVPFSCKGRGFCLSCGGRRMTESAARLVDAVLPPVPVRVLLDFQCHRGRRHGIRDGRSGCVTVIQRFGGGLNLNIHFHTLVLDGVFFVEGEGGALGFRPLSPPTDDEVGLVLARIATRVQRVLRRRGLDPSDADLSQFDPVVEESPALAGSVGPRSRGASPWGPARARGCGALGTILRRRGCSRPLLGTRISRASICTPMSRCRGGIACAGSRLCRYLLRPAVAQDRLGLLADGRVVLTLKAAWADGTRQLVFEPLELLEKLAALTPRPRINLVLYHGVLAPHARWRARVVAYGAPPVEAAAAAGPPDHATDEPVAARSRHWAWADLMRRAFDIDVLVCPRCGGRLRLLGTVEDPEAIRAILAALALSRGRADRAPPLAPPQDTSHAAASGA